MAWKPCVLTVVLCAVCGALGYGTLNSTLNTIVNRQVPEKRRPQAVSTYWAFSDIGVGFAPAILGAVVSLGGYGSMYFFGAFMSALALPLYFLCWGRRG